MNYHKRILDIAVPSIVTNITVPLLGLVDVAITGHMGGASFVGAISVGGMLMSIIYWLFNFLRMGTSGLTAQALGRRDWPEVAAMLMKANMVALALAALLICLQVPIRTVALGLIAPSEEVGELAATYFSICVWGAPAVLLLQALSGWFLGMQDSRAPMIIAIVQNVSNVLLSLLLVYALQWKIEGVALGTVLAQYVGLAVGLAFLLRHRSLLTHRPARLTGMRQFFSLNKYIFLRTLCLIFVHFYFISAGARFGTTALAINALIMQFFLLYSYIMDGFAFAGEALVGKAAGECNEAALTTIIKQLFGWGTAMMLTFTAIYATCDSSLLTLLTDDAALLTGAHDYHVWALLLPLCGMAAFIWDGIFVGLTAPRPMLAGIVAGVGVFVSAFVLLAPTLGNHALWLAFNAYVLTRGLVQTLIYLRRPARL